nr:hypothetical protein [Tanacetum cinerariifolium]
MVEKSKLDEDKEGKVVDLSHYHGDLRTIDTTIDQQVAIDETLVPTGQRLKIGQSNFCLLSDIKSKESTLQLVYDVLHQNTQQFGALLPIELTNDAIRNSKAYKEYHAISIGEAVPKPKASVRRTKSSSDCCKSLTLYHFIIDLNPETRKKKEDEMVRFSKERKLERESEREIE